MKKLVVGITAPGSVILIAGQMQYFKSLGYETYLLAPTHEKVSDYCQREGCIHLAVNLEREISPLKDAKALIQIIKHLKRVKPDIVNFGTPKVSLLGMIAAKMLGIKNRIYTCRGFRFETEKGKKRNLLIFLEKVTSKFSHQIICISPSLKLFGIKLNVFPEEKAFVINKGSSNGINLSRFNIENINQSESLSLKSELGISDNFCFGFIGRLSDEKGINELFCAFDHLYHAHKNLRLLLIGSIDNAQITDKSIIENIKTHEGIIYLGHQSNIPLYLSLFDVFVMPTHREGFGNVFVEAAAIGLPVIGTDVTGSKDAVSKDYNGLLVPVKSTTLLQEAMLSLYNDEAKRKELGLNGIEWAKNFDNKMIWDSMNDLYQMR